MVKALDYLTHNWENKGIHTFPKGISLKMNVIVQLEFELAYYDSAVHRFNSYTPRTTSQVSFSITNNSHIIIRFH